MKHDYTNEIRQFILDNYKDISTEELTKRINLRFNAAFTCSRIKSYKSNHKLQSGYVSHTCYNKNFYAEHREFLKSNSEGIGNAETTKMFNEYFGTDYSVDQIKSVKSRYHISSGLTGWWPGGHTPMNKGKKWDEYMNKEAQLKSLKTTFKKGNKSYNCDPIGTEKWKKSGTHPDDIGFLYVKVTDGKRQHNWKQKHRLLWEKAYGPIPRGYKVIFANGDRTDMRLENLVLVSNSQMLIMNSQNLICEDPEATKVGANVAKILDRVNQLKRIKRK